MNKKCLIFLNGVIEDYDYIKNKIVDEYFIIAVDGGLKHIMELELYPDLILGDFDSSVFSEALKYRKAEIKKYNKDKNFTDGEIAINYAIKEKFDEVMIIGALGNRMDHTFSNVFMLEKLNDNNIIGTIIEKNNEINYLNKKIIINGNGFKYFSIVPISKKIEGLIIKNAKYDLDNEIILRTQTRGISNEFINKDVLISIIEGSAFVIKSN